MEREGGGRQSEGGERGRERKRKRDRGRDREGGREKDETDVERGRRRKR